MNLFNQSEFLALALVHFFIVVSPGPDFAVTLRQLLQHLRQSCCVMEQRIALPQAKLPGFYRQKTLFCTNNLPGCIKNCQRGCIVACIDPERITAHCSADSATASSLRPWSRATAPSRPFTNW